MTGDNGCLPPAGVSVQFGRRKLEVTLPDGQEVVGFFR